MKNLLTDQPTNSLPLDEIYGDVKRIKVIFYWFISLVSAGLTVGVFILLSAGDVLPAIQTGIAILPIVLSVFFVRREKFELAAVILAIVLIVLLTFIATNDLGVHHISVIGYPTVIIVSSLVIRKRTMALLTLITLGCIAWLVFGEISGAYTPAPLIRSVPGDFYSVSMIIILTAVMVRLVTETLFQTNKQLQKELDVRADLINQLEVKNAEAETLQESASAVALSLELEETVELILDQLQRVVPYDSASIQLLIGTELEIIGSRGFPESKDATGMRFTLDENDPAYPVVRDKLPYIFYPNIQSITNKFKGPFHEHIFSWIAIPLYARGKLIGFFTLDGFEVNKFTEAHAKFALTFANQVAITLENSRLYSKLQSELKEREGLIEELESKNAELERFTYTVSHDLKSPLITISGFLGQMQDDIASGNTSRIERDSQRIHQAVDKMHQLLKELLELSRIGRLMNPPETVPFEELAREALVLVHGQLELRGVTFTLEPDLPVVYGDRLRLIEVLQNLIDNAVKFMGNQPEPKIEIGQQGEEDGKPIFFVRDNGVGIAPEYHERVFGLFDKLDAKSEGTGIGLALVKRIVEVHGGKIWVESHGVGEGATFYFTLPVSQTRELND